MILNDTLELRDQLMHAWRAVFDGAIDRGCPEQAVVETMASMAHERFAEIFGTAAAASYLQLLAEQMRATRLEESLDLIQGHAPPDHSTQNPEDGYEPDRDVSLTDLLS